MTEFFRFPRTPHVFWLGEGQPRDDKVLSATEAEALLANEVIVEEKVDGANLGLSTTEDGALRAQNRGGYLERENAHPQFRTIWSWLSAHEADLTKVLWPNLILFGEWCYAVHSVVYDRLPDWFLGFDVYDREADRFWDTARRDALLREVGLHSVPWLGQDRFPVPALRALLGASRVGSNPMEGLVVRRQEDGWTTARGKLVRAQFTQTIREHWSRRPVRRNALAEGVAAWR